MREEYLEYGGFGKFTSLGENDSVTYDQMVQGPSKSVTHTLYGRGFQVSFLASKDDLDGIIARNAPELKRSMRVSVQTTAAALWNNAFSTTLTADGQFLCDDDHTYLRGGSTFSNTPGSVALGHASLETALISFRKIKNFMGDPAPMIPSTLLIPPDLEPIAHELIASSLRHDTTTHADSWLTGKLSIESWPFLSSATAWWVLSPKDQLKVYWMWRIRPETTHGFDFDKSTAKTKTLYACSTAAIDPRGVYGTPGA
jgi:phage major head subunit gpT-like protein